MRQPGQDPAGVILLAEEVPIDRVQYPMAHAQSQQAGHGGKEQ
jgi:hypothetical protein